MTFTGKTVMEALSSRAVPQGTIYWVKAFFTRSLLVPLRPDFLALR
jgi:hypothetical protein